MEELAAAANSGASRGCLRPVIQAVQAARPLKMSAA